MYRVAVIGLTSLEAYAMSNILNSTEGIESESFQDFNIFVSLQERFAIYIVSSDIFASNLDFFLPKKGRYIVLTNESSSRYPMVSKNSDISVICERIAMLIGCQGKIDESGSLSSREIEVLKALVSGKTVKEIADCLFISPNTVITHRKNISAKLGIKSISGLSLYALMNGLISDIEDI